MSSPTEQATLRTSPGQAGELVLDVVDLSTVYATANGIVHAVRGVDLRVARGQKIGIVGESGSGKSALALSIAGLIEPPGHVTHGDVLLAGVNIAELSDRALRRFRGKELGIVFQDPMTALNPAKTIGAQIVEAVRTHQGVSRAAARRLAMDLLGDVEISQPAKRLDDYPHQYSGGMRQRVLIAIALANRPALVIADEPTTALDVTTQAQILILLDRLASEAGSAVIMITHNLGLVAQFCESVHVMYAGRFVESAPASKLFTTPSHPYTHALMQAVPRPDRLIEGPLYAIPGLPPDLRDVRPGCPFEPRCPVGHGNDKCITTTPVPRQPNFAGSDSAVSVECHYPRSDP